VGKYEIHKLEFDTDDPYVDAVLATLRRYDFQVYPAAWVDVKKPSTKYRKQAKLRELKVFTPQAIFTNYRVGKKRARLYYRAWMHANMAYAAFSMISERAPDAWYGEWKVKGIDHTLDGLWGVFAKPEAIRRYCKGDIFFTSKCLHGYEGVYYYVKWAFRGTIKALREALKLSPKMSESELRLRGRRIAALAGRNHNDWFAQVVDAGVYGGVASTGPADVIDYFPEFIRMKLKYRPAPTPREHPAGLMAFPAGVPIGPCPPRVPPPQPEWMRGTNFHRTVLKFAATLRKTERKLYLRWLNTHVPLIDVAIPVAPDFVKADVLDASYIIDDDFDSAFQFTGADYFHVPYNEYAWLAVYLAGGPGPLYGRRGVCEWIERHKIPNVLEVKKAREFYLELKRLKDRFKKWYLSELQRAKKLLAEYRRIKREYERVLKAYRELKKRVWEYRYVYWTVKREFLNVKNAYHQVKRVVRRLLESYRRLKKLAKKERARYLKVKREWLRKLRAYREFKKRVAAVRREYRKIRSEFLSIKREYLKVKKRADAAWREYRKAYARFQSFRRKYRSIKAKCEKLRRKYREYLERARRAKTREEWSYWFTKAAKVRRQYWKCVDEKRQAYKRLRELFRNMAAARKKYRSAREEKLKVREKYREARDRKREALKRLRRMIREKKKRYEELRKLRRLKREVLMEYVRILREKKRALSRLREKIWERKVLYEDLRWWARVMWEALTRLRAAIKERKRMLELLKRLRERKREALEAFRRQRLLVKWAKDAYRYWLKEMLRALHRYVSMLKRFLLAKRKIFEGLKKTVKAYKRWVRAVIELRRFAVGAVREAYRIYKAYIKAVRRREGRWAVWRRYCIQTGYNLGMRHVVKAREFVERSLALRSAYEHVIRSKKTVRLTPKAYASKAFRPGTRQRFYERFVKTLFNATLSVHFLKFEDDPNNFERWEFKIELDGEFPLRFPKPNLKRWPPEGLRPSDLARALRECAAGRKPMLLTDWFRKGQGEIGLNNADWIFSDLVNKLMRWQRRLIRRVLDELGCEYDLLNQMPAVWEKLKWKADPLHDLPVPKLYGKYLVKKV